MEKSKGQIYCEKRWPKLLYVYQLTLHLQIFSNDAFLMKRRSQRGKFIMVKRWTFLEELYIGMDGLNTWWALWHPSSLCAGYRCEDWELLQGAPHLQQDPDSPLLTVPTWNKKAREEVNNNWNHKKDALINNKCHHSDYMLIFKKEICSFKPQGT